MPRTLATLRVVSWGLAAPALAQLGPGADDPATAPSAAVAAELFGSDEPLGVVRVDEGVPGWTVEGADSLVGHIGSIWEVAALVGYSGRPLDLVVAVGPKARIAGAKLVRHNEPVLTLRISDAGIAAYVAGFSGHELMRPFEDAAADLPDVISRATVSTGVIGDGILRTASSLAEAAEIFAAAAVPVVAGEGGFLRLWAGLADPPIRR